MTKLYTLKQNTLGVPCTPGKWAGKPQYKDYLEILMTCGGGMGGKSWYEYIAETETDFTVVGPMIYVKDIEGNFIWLNTRYVVKAQKVNVMTVKYNSENTGHLGLLTERWIVNGNVTLNDKFESRIELTRGQ